MLEDRKTNGYSRYEIYQESYYGLLAKELLKLPLELHEVHTRNGKVHYGVGLSFTDENYSYSVVPEYKHWEKYSISKTEKGYAHTDKTIKATNITANQVVDWFKKELA